jgi:hypothetical protein
MKWGTDSGGSGAASEQAALVTAMISEVPHFSQEFCELTSGQAASFRFHHLVFRPESIPVEVGAIST